ncbi:serine hydrolase domain-containing protein [Bailinhaonella thermotolerans]|uniref:Class A beta-lactamase-related serine hydrolase n=1 Tax=Bailinhaonella thermotolerans TaxID=1070861 RepID=A0A3A4B3W1_9ACTN|nr:serine hydrolase domain-containing protein [Bailinhaonella thermotolerans]RJL32060.1 class A beta-lactamase-related serine hydrolase [Bailinhaonella thermotolerans]
MLLRRKPFRWGALTCALTAALLPSAALAAPISASTPASISASASASASAPASADAVRLAPAAADAVRPAREPADAVRTTREGLRDPAATARAFADDLVPGLLREHQVPGAAVTVVAGGRRVLAQGYGVAEVETGRRVDPAGTVFAPASIAKLITATAVMQLVERGRIDLDEDVNEYLTKFKIDDAFPGRPVTAHHLLTHSAGFRGGDFGTGAATPEQVHDLGEHLADHQPDRVRPPGTRAVYSNYGMGLAGYLVEVRSGMPFHRYVEENIFRPLGMTRSTMAQPEPAAIAAALAPGYRLADGRQVRAEGAKYGHMPPHGAGFRSTATDMAAFMLAHLDGGGKILRPESVRLMQSRRFGNAEGTSGMGYGFQEYTRGGTRLLVHRANIPGYFAIMALIPELRVGVYASFNGSGKGGPDSAWKLVAAFADAFTARPTATPATTTPAATTPAATTPAATTPAAAHATTAGMPDISTYAGTYRPVLASDMTDVGKVSALMNVATVTAGPDGILTTTGAVALGPAETRQWVQTAPGLFREKNGHRVIRFGPGGLLATENPAGPLERLSWYQSPSLHLGTLGVTVTFLLLSALAWPVVAAVRRARRRTGRTAGAAGAPRKAPGFAGLAGWLTAALVTASAGSLVMMFANFEGNQAKFFTGGSPLFTAITTLPVIALVATALTLVTTVLAGARRWWSPLGRAHHSLVALAAVAYLLVALEYNVLA